MLLQQIVNGIGVGCTYALIALGFNVLFGVLRIVNLAYGEIFMAGSFAALSMWLYVSQNPLLVAVAAVVGAILAGVLIHLLAVKPLGPVSNLNSPRHLAVIVSTMGCSLSLQSLALVMFGAYPRRFPVVFPLPPVRILRIQIDGRMILVASATIVMLGMLSLFFRSTKLGIRIRSLADNPDLSVCVGINVAKDQLMCVVLSSGLAGVAALLTCQSVGAISPLIGFLYGLKALVVVVVGGLGNLMGTVIVAILLGSAESLTVAYFSSSYRDAVAFALLLGVVAVGGIRRTPGTEI